MQSFNKACQGFTLSELMIAIALVSLLLALAFPSFQDTLIRNRIASETNQLMSLFHLARNTAINSSSTVAVCKSSDLVSCSTSMEGDWSAGQIVYIDRDQNGAIDAEDLLYTHGPVKGSLTFSAFGSNNKVTYDPIGATFSNGTLVLCPENKQAKFARAIIINSAGRARLSQDQDQDGLHENGSGKSLTCH